MIPPERSNKDSINISFSISTSALIDDVADQLIQKLLQSKTSSKFIAILKKCNEQTPLQSGDVQMPLQSGDGHENLIKIIQLAEHFYSETMPDEEKEFIETIRQFLTNILCKITDSDWILRRKLLDVSAKFYLVLDINSMRGKMVTNFLNMLENNLDEIFWMKKSIFINKIEETLRRLKGLAQENIKYFEDSLIAGRFDKKDTGLTLIVGDEGGLYLMLNSLTEEEVKTLIGSGCLSVAYLKKHSSETPGNPPSSKIILGEGGFGKLDLLLI